MADGVDPATWVLRGALFVVCAGLLGLVLPAVLTAGGPSLPDAVWSRPLALLAFVAGALLALSLGYRVARRGMPNGSLATGFLLGLVCFSATIGIAFATLEVGSVLLWGSPGLVFTALVPGWLAARDIQRERAKTNRLAV